MPLLMRYFFHAGRISRKAWFVKLLAASLVCLMLASFLGQVADVLLLIPAVLFLWSAISLSGQRLHDTGRSAHLIWLSLIPVFGPFYLLCLLLKRGETQPNKHGPVTQAKPDYLQVNIAK